MDRIDKDFITSGTLSSQDNTWSGRYSPVIPFFTKKNNSILVSANGESDNINDYDEATLYLLVKYLFIPIWLIDQWYESNGIIISGSETIKTGRDKVRKWIKLNLCWIDSSPTGMYLRPTKALFTMFEMPMERYSGIPTNTLTHTIAEISFSHDLMVGNASSSAGKILRKLKTLPRQSFLGLEPRSEGTNIVAESDFRNPTMWSKEGMRKTMEKEAEIEEAYENGKTLSPELLDFRYFSIIKKIDNTGVPKKDFISHVPDIIIPVIRNNGKPQSIAIEMELTSKGVKGYIESINRFKAGDKKFGYVIYMCGGNGVAESLKKAYREVGGAGNIKFMIMDYLIPYPRFEL